MLAEENGSSFDSSKIMHRDKDKMQNNKENIASASFTVSRPVLSLRCKYVLIIDSYYTSCGCWESSRMIITHIRPAGPWDCQSWIWNVCRWISAPSWRPAWGPFTEYFVLNTFHNNHCIFSIPTTFFIFLKHFTQTCLRLSGPFISDFTNGGNLLSVAVSRSPCVQGSDQYRMEM